jgi:hypothetical protein
MKKHVLIFFLSIFLIGNYHVASDWCDDIGINSANEIISLVDHDADNDLCGHCGHLGLNIMQVASSDLNVIFNISKSNPIELKLIFDSNFTSPPTPPPLSFS